MLAEGFLLHYKKDEIANGMLWENHCHAQFELIAVLTGDVCVTLEGKDIRLADGEAILIPPLCYHTVTVRKKCTYRRVTAAFEDAIIPPVLGDMLRKRVPHAFRAEQTDRLRTLCEEGDEGLWAPLAHALMIQVLYDCATDTEQSDSIGADPVLHKALLYIEEHLCEKISLDSIAAGILSSKSFLCHRFQEKMKVSPKQYILRKRMALAAKLIREGVPPTEVALRVGYENYSNFYRMYQKHLQKAPSEK